MFTGSLMQLSDVKAMQAGNVPKELESRFWSRADGQITVQHFSPGEAVAYQPHTHSEYTVIVCLAGAVSKTQSGDLPHRNRRNDGRQLWCGTRQRLFARRSRGLPGSFPVGGPPHPGPSAGASELALASGPKKSGVRRQIARARHPARAQEIAQELRNRKLGQGIVIEGLATRMLIETLRAAMREHRSLPGGLDATAACAPSSWRLRVHALVSQGRFSFGTAVRFSGQQRRAL